MHRSLAAAVATFAAMAALSAGSTAPKAQAVSRAFGAVGGGAQHSLRLCEAQRTSCLKACHRGYFYCNRQCNGPYQFCRHNIKTGPYKPGGVGAKQNDPRPKKGIDPTQPPLKWVPNSPAKAKGVPSVPVGGTWNPSSSFDAKGPMLRSRSGRR